MKRASGIGLVCLLGVVGSGAAAAPLPCPSVDKALADAEFLLKRTSPSPEAQAADRKAALAALDARERSRSTVRDAQPGPGAHGGISHSYQQSRQAADPRRRELFARVAEDQFARASFDIIGRGADWAHGLSATAAAFVRHIVAAETCRRDAENTMWLKADLKANGWYSISKAGSEADRAAWLLVQHADADPDFQSEVLAMLAKLLAAGETERSNYAYLFDRVAIAQGRSQRYGTQGRCTGPAAWEPRDLEDPAAIDRIRAEAGLPPLAEYKATVARLCH